MSTGIILHRVEVLRSAVETESKSPPEENSKFKTGLWTAIEEMSK